MKLNKIQLAILFGLGTSFMIAPNSPVRANNLTIQEKLENYRINIGDSIIITVLNHPEFSLAAQVLPDGTIAYPILGKIKVVGRTRDEISVEIATGLKKKNQLNKPFVTVNVAQREVREVTVLGTVRGAGKLPLKDDWTVLDALGAAGGVGAGGAATDRYEFYTAQLFRDAQVIPLDLGKVFANNPEANISLKNGDKIYVSVKPRSEITVTVIGEIANGHGGTVELPKDRSIVTVLNDLGGVSEYAALSKSTILRKGNTLKVDLRGFKKGSIEQNILLEGGDVLTVPRIDDRYKVNGAIEKRGEQLYPDDRKLTLFDILTQSGIPSNGADLKKVSVTRVDKGIATTQTHNVEKMLKGDRSQDMEILPGDEIYVPPVDPNKRKLGFQEIFGILTVLPGLYFLLRGSR
jgi:protein involved in polysaccharide export with SLBB domain